MDTGGERTRWVASPPQPLPSAAPPRAPGTSRPRRSASHVLPGPSLRIVTEEPSGSRCSLTVAVTIVLRDTGTVLSARWGAVTTGGARLEVSSSRLLQHQCECQHGENGASCLLAACSSFGLAALLKGPWSPRVCGPHIEKRCAGPGAALRCGSTLPCLWLPPCMLFFFF